MQTQTEIQPIDPVAVKARMRQFGVTQLRVGRELKRSQGAIARALRGERKVLLGRIVRWLDRYERRRQQRAA